MSAILQPTLRGVLRGVLRGGLILPLASLYLGQVATKSRIPTNRSTSNKTAMSRSHHIARDTITSLQIELPNWYWNRAGVGPETSGGGNITFTASIEYPAGVFTQVLFSGSASTVVASGSSVLSDAVAVSIPNGADFWVRVFANAATAIVFTEGNTGYEQRDLGNGEAYEYSGGATIDKTMGGTINDNGHFSAPIFVPSAIVAMTRKPSVLIIGDSRAWGFKDIHDSSGDLGEIARSIGPSLGYINAASSGDTLSGFNSSHAKRVALKQYCSHVIVQTAINSLRSGGSGQNKSAATVLGEQQTAIGLFSDKEVWTTTTLPQSTSTDAWATDTNQTVNPNHTEIVAYNDAIRAGVAGSAGYFEIANVLERPGENGGLWAYPGVTDDGLHALQGGQFTIRDSGAVDPSRLTRT